MKITTVYGFTSEEIEILGKAGKILGDLTRAYSEPSEDAKALDNTTKDLIGALKDVLNRI